MRKSSIAPSVIQTLFDSAANAADKGQAQWFTSLDWARALSLPLNEYRPVIADLTCGNGQLLGGCNASSQNGDGDAHATKPAKSIHLGCDLETPSPMPRSLSHHFVTADITRFYSKLRAVDWRCDLFVANPPWDLHWYREPLAGLLESECPAVREAFAAHDGRTSRDTIDSTIATLCIALDRSSSFTEGFLIGNESTLQRLLFAENAPHRALVAHLWAHLIIPGNICSPSTLNSQHSTGFHTGVIYFARGHDRGPQSTKSFAVGCSLLDVEGSLKELKRQRYTFRDGPEAASYLCTKNADTLWQAAREEHLREAGLSHQPEFNIWFDALAGVIRTHLNLFDTASGRVDNSAAAALHALNGRQPIQLVVQRSQRQALLDAVKAVRPPHRHGLAG